MFKRGVENIITFTLLLGLIILTTAMAVFEIILPSFNKSKKSIQLNRLEELEVVDKNGWMRLLLLFGKLR